jgi:hypothetical protein
LGGAEMKKHRNGKSTSKGKGFDLGLLPKIALVPDSSFIELLGKADIYACAYGEEPVDDQDLVPNIFLVGRNEAPLRSAFDCFKGWGCEIDGDVVDVWIAFRPDGSYDMAILPNFLRTHFRLSRDPSLAQAMQFNVAWIKHFDSTNPLLRQIQKYKKSPLPAVRLGAAAPPSLPSRPEDLKPISGLPRLLKFEIRFSEESELAEGDLFYAFDQRNNRRRQVRDMPAKLARDKPEGIAKARRQVIQTAFPITRERVRRTGLYQKIRDNAPFAGVTEDQVVQACVNILMSEELCSGKRHYTELSAKKFVDQIWKHIWDRFEFADGNQRVELVSESDLKIQVDLDARSLLVAQGFSAPSSLPFLKVQNLLSRKGYLSE